MNSDALFHPIYRRVCFIQGFNRFATTFVDREAFEGMPGGWWRHVLRQVLRIDCPSEIKSSLRAYWNLLENCNQILKYLSPVVDIETLFVMSHSEPSLEKISSSLLFRAQSLRTFRTLSNAVEIKLSTILQVVLFPKYISSDAFVDGFSNLGSNSFEGRFVICILKRVWSGHTWSQTHYTISRTILFSRFVPVLFSKDSIVKLLEGKRRRSVSMSNASHTCVNLALGFCSTTWFSSSVSTSSGVDLRFPS